ncbi:RyR domain-containing protein [[Clostridium] fimetarium]|uniref:RyR domain-containing protein n=1 Tax=[Clostridium] fimetarium TaxID=99656 RepID=A0A1I0RPA2_9FIRM|nr:RyR domain-containing protein [[Clostridium] fimetarium]SEW43099.1 RyR domain-containing protein [[Clostridium] fimetarium]
MDNKDVKIAVTGDVCINLMQWSIDRKCTRDLSWKNYPNVFRTFKDGEALLLSKLVEMSTGVSVIAPQIGSVDGYIQDKVLVSSTELELFPITDSDNNKTYRVKQYLGFTGPTFGEPKLFPIINDDENADMVIIDDENNGFNSNEDFWPLALKSLEKSPIVLYKTNRLNCESLLWKHIEKYHIENTVVVINGNDLRSKGVNISRGLSWEKTALDFVWQMSNNPKLASLAKSRHLIVPLGLEGAIYYNNQGETAQSHLYFLTNESEGEFIKESQGKMYGMTSCFVAGLARAMVSGMNKNDKFICLDDGIREGMVATQKYFMNGFGKTVEDSFPNPLIFEEKENDFIYKENIQDVLIRNTSNPNCQGCWYIIKDKSSNSLLEIAYNIVKNGEKSALRFIPIARFGNLKVVDRTEIENFRSIKNLMTEYIYTSNVVRPLAIAVFGTPGSGKSFGVTEVASSIAPELIVKLDFNLSQFHSISDLATAFHKVRDLSLQGKLPLVFFDEFDSDLNGKLGWLKYFLAPMQDGTFREGDSIHPIGKAIFVFAGGTSSTFKEFCGENISDEKDYDKFFREFQSTKGPDFISRLRGYVNILGPNQTDNEWDQLFIIRRAMLLRSLIERKTPYLINERGEAQIDYGVVCALLKVGSYKHEARSMEAIIEMSRLSHAKEWEQSHLPSKEQLKLHVDEEEFLRLLMKDTFFSEKIETLAKDLHNSRLENHRELPDLDLPCKHYWELTDEDYKETLRSRVKNIPDALQKIKYDLISVKEKCEIIEFTEAELNILSVNEHKQWSLEKKEKGWVYGSIIDEKNKTHSSLVSWMILPKEEKDKIMKDIKAWPKILADAKLKIEKMKYLCYCEVNGFDAGSR